MGNGALMVLGIGLDLVDVETIELAFRRGSACAEGWCSEAELLSLGARREDAKTLPSKLARAKWGF